MTSVCNNSSYCTVKNSSIVTSEKDLVKSLGQNKQAIQGPESWEKANTDKSL